MEEDQELLDAEMEKKGYLLCESCNEYKHETSFNADDVTCDDCNIGNRDWNDMEDV